MSQSTLDPNTSPENAVGDQPGAQPAAPRRRRRPLSRAKAAAAQAEQTTETTPEAAPARTPAAPLNVAPPAPLDATPPVVAAEAPPATRSPRSRRGGDRRAAGRKAGVQLVVPGEGQADGTEATAATETATESAAAHEPAASGQTAATVAHGPRVVPVTTEPAAEGAPAASTTPVAQAASAATPAPEQAATSEPPRRYRFGRRTTNTQPAASLRPERLSGTLATPAESEPQQEEPAREAAAAFTPPVPELRIRDEEPAAAAPEQREETTHDVLADIVSALGLQSGTTPAGTAPHAAAEHGDEEPAEDTEEAEGAEGAEGGEQQTSDGEQQAGRRRRRRRRSSTHAVSAADEEAEEQPAAPWAATDERRSEPARETSAVPYEEPLNGRNGNGYQPYSDLGYDYTEQQPYSPYTRPQRERPAAEAQPWDIMSGQQQVRQPESPFGAPEPCFARGFGPQPRGVAGPARESYGRAARTERGTDLPPMSPNVLASTVTHAIQQQTDRLLTELRHQATPPAMTVMFPPFPSTERVGVFVDVANLLYSSRNLRVSIDFGRLLDFLRGNRRLLRAHAYAPTNPDPHAEQAFLSAVKGLGYRITTKNYKTFASGAKKADMDLDMCMDIVKLVDARAVDTIVLVSGDSDFLPLLEYCSDRGVRVEVAAFEDAAAMILRQSCDLFINLSLVDDIRA